MKLHTLDGDCAVGRHAAIGGDAKICGSIRIAGDLVVDGWARVRHIYGPCKGLFSSEADLKRSWPKPQDGSWALVGDTLPAAVWRAYGREWQPTGAVGGATELHLDGVDSLLQANAAAIAANAEAIAANERAIADTNEEVAATQAAAEALSRRADAQSADISAAQSAIEANAQHISAMRGDVRALEEAQQAEAQLIAGLRRADNDLDSRIADNSEDIAALSHSVAGLADTFDSLTGPSANKLDPEAAICGKYLHYELEGDLLDGPNYFTTGPIEVRDGVLAFAVTWDGEGCLDGASCAKLYDAAMRPISFIANSQLAVSGGIKVVPVAPGAAYVRISGFHAGGATAQTLARHAMAQELRSLDIALLPFTPYGKKLREEVMPFDAVAIDLSARQALAVARLAADDASQSLAAAQSASESMLRLHPLCWHHAAIGDMAVGATHTEPNFPRLCMKGKSLAFSAVADGELGGVTIGWGPEGTYGAAILSVGASTVSIRRWFTGAEEPFYSAEHGLSISGRFWVLLSIDGDGESASLHIVSASGTFSHQLAADSILMACGAPFVAAASPLSGCRLSMGCADLRSPVWLLGDSYLGATSDQRVGYHLRRMGVWRDVAYLAQGGIGSAGMLAELKRCLALAQPRALAWCVGMNDSSDSAWIANTAEALALCDQRGIEAILYCVPSTPTLDHSAKRAWALASGRRCIDAAAAVSANADAQWLPGYLSPDNVHPLAPGAAAIAAELALAK